MSSTPIDYLTEDTPASGEQISGQEFTSSGWAITPPPKSIPTDGSTIWVWMDGTRLGNPTYNQYREDVATLFPEYNNSQGAGGYFSFSPNQFRNGAHTLVWSATDDTGESDFIDSKCFRIHNPNSPPPPPGYLELKNLYQQDTTGSMDLGIEEIRRGYTLEPSSDFQVVEQGAIAIEVEEMEPVEIRFKTKAQGQIRFFGWGEQEWETLPMGTSLKHEDGVFCWIPTPGFLGTFVFNFACTDGTYISKAQQVRVKIIAKLSEASKKKQREIKR